MERDEVYVPKTREDLGIPKRAREEIDWEEIFGDTPLYTLYMLVRQQLLAFPAYLRERHRYWRLWTFISCYSSVQCFWAKVLPLAH